MLRSWIERKRAAFSNGRAEAVVGIEIGRHAVSRVEVHASDDGWRLRDSARCELSTPLYSGRPDATHASAVTDALRQIAPDLAKRYVPVHVAVPDPVVAVAVLELDTLPSGRKAQLELTHWMMKKERFATGEEPVCVCQPLGEEAGKQLLLAAAIDSGWHGCLFSALRAAGIVPWSLNAAATYAHNLWHPRLSSLGTAGALVRLDSDSWTLTLWDKRTAPRLVRSRWRERSAMEFELISTEVERTILSYIHGGAGREVKAVYASAPRDEMNGLTAALDSRLTTPCIAIAADESLSGESTTDIATAPAALLAAVA